MDFSKDFFIVATYPFNFSWTYGEDITNTELYHFRYKNGYISSYNNLLYLKILDSKIVYVPKIEDANKFDIELDDCITNFRIKIDDKYIRHKDSKLYCMRDDKSSTFKQDSTWIFIENKINPEHTFVIARYNEDVNWTRYLPGKVIIYNKGKDEFQIDNSRNNISIRQLDNFGREGHSYLYYIIENYDKLTERVTFLQGDPFDHSPDLLELCCMEKDYDEIQCLSLWYKDNYPGNHITNLNIKYLNGARYGIYPIDNLGIIDGIEEVYIKKEWREKYNKIGNWGGVINILSHFYTRLGLEHKIKNSYLMIISALFSLTKEKIKLYSKEEYNLICSELLLDPQGGMEVYLLERMWYEIYR